MVARGRRGDARMRGRDHQLRQAVAEGGDLDAADLPTVGEFDRTPRLVGARDPAHFGACASTTFTVSKTLAGATSMITVATS